MRELITQSEYARRKGISRQAVNKAMKNGSIASQKGMLIWEEQTDSVAERSQHTLASVRLARETVKYNIDKLDLEMKKKILLTGLR
jgi:hypothetical protein